MPTLQVTQRRRVSRQQHTDFPKMRRELGRDTRTPPIGTLSRASGNRDAATSSPHPHAAPTSANPPHHPALAPAGGGALLALLHFLVLLSRFLGPQPCLALLDALLRRRRQREARKKRAVSTERLSAGSERAAVCTHMAHVRTCGHRVGTCVCVCLLDCRRAALARHNQARSLATWPPC